MEPHEIAHLGGLLFLVLMLDVPALAVL